MKMYCLLLLLSCISVIAGSGQPVKDSATHSQSYEYYSTLGKTQKNAARVLIVGGVIFQVVSLGIVANHLLGVVPPGAAVFFYTGTGMVVAGIPLLIAANKKLTKAKQLTVAVKIQNSNFRKGTGLAGMYYPAFPVQLPL